MDNRKYMGENKEGAIFPIAPNFPEMSGNYLEFIEEIKNEIRRQRVYVVLNANYSMIYTDMGIDPFNPTGSSIQSAFAKRAGHAIIFSMIFTLEGNSKT